jgi:carnosine N-methyltransferase
VLQSANVFQSEDQFRLINVPDVAPHDIPQGVDFSMAAGDFLEAFPDEDEGTGSRALKQAPLDRICSLMLTRDMSAGFDCVVTCFFMDTAKNVVSYVENIHRLLKPGGVWVNMGT